MSNLKEIKTPKYNDLPPEVWDNVYEPREDTFLMIDAIEKDYLFIEKKKPSIIVEIGAGSGVVLTAIKQNFHTSHCIAIDINKFACSVCFAVSKQNNVNIDVVNSDLAHCIKPHSIDCVVFNPPYVLTEDDEYNSCSLSMSWAGGTRGTNVTNSFIFSLNSMLSLSGFGYLLLLKENNLGEICKIISSTGFDCSVVLERKIIGEHLYVVRFSRKLCTS